LDQGGDVNVKDRWGATPLDDAKDDEIRAILEKKGALSGTPQTVCSIPQSIFGENETRLIYAAQAGDLLLLQRLNILGWNVNAYDYDGRTALLLAVSEGHLEIVKYLVSHGCRLDQKDFRGNDAVSEAKRCGHEQILEYLTSIE
jgi:ankyrin repeat protein